MREESPGHPFRTDNGNFLLDCRFSEGIPEPRVLDRELASRAGILESGLFLGLAQEVLVGGPQGVKTLSLPRSYPD